MPVPLPNDAFYLGSRYYRCIGDWALPDIAGTGSLEFTFDTANAAGVIPANAIAIDLRCSASFKGIGVSGTPAIAHVISIAIPATNGGGADQNIMKATEPNGVVVGAEYAKAPIQMIAVITNNINNPEFVLNLTLDNTVLEDVGIRGYWMP